MSQERVEELAKKMDRLKGKIAEADKRYAQLRNELEQELIKRKITLCDIDDGQDEILRVSRVNSSSVTYDLKKLRKKLSKDVIKRIITISIDNKKVDQVYEEGLIPFEVLKKACKLKPCFRITVMRVKRPEELANSEMEV